ncbi:MAG: pilus assembly protein PilM [Agathobacter sp.]|nr:pilus assembly protein PilM [Agathobacter sp.]
MANKVLGIEIGQNLTRVVEIDYKVKNPKIYNMFSFATPPDMVTDAGVEVNSIFKAMLQSKLKENHISTNKAIFVLNSARIANREIEIPFVKDNKIKDLITANASDYFPVDLSQYQLVHEVLDRYGEGDSKKIKVSVLAVPNEIIRSYRFLAENCKLTLMGLDYTGNAIKQLMLKEIPEDVKVTIKIDESVSILTIMDGEHVVLQRIINYGIGEGVEAIQDSELFGEYLSFIEAMDVARRRTLLQSRFGQDMQPVAENPEQGVPQQEQAGDIDSEKLAKLKEYMTDSMQMLVGSIARVLDYYISRNSEKTIEKIYLTGMGADFSGLSRLMSNELNQKVVSLQQFEGLSLHKNINITNFKLAEFFTCIGCALDPLPIYGGDKKGRLKKGEDAGFEGAEAAEKEESLTGALILMAIFIIGAIGMAAYGIFGNLVLKADNVTLQSKIDELSYAQETADEYNIVKAEHDWIKQLDDVTVSENNNLVAFIKELEQKMPTQIQVISLTASETGLTLSIDVEKKAAVADVISELRTFKSIEVHAMSDIVDEKDEETGKTTVNFTIECNYVNAVDDTQSTEVSAPEAPQSTEASTETEATTENATENATEQ